MNTPATPSTPLAAELHPAPAAPPVLDIVARIAECAPELREAERKVAAFILADLARAAHASIGALARDAEVSVATVTRFAKAVGCRDVRELKVLVAQAAAVGQRFLEPSDDAPADDTAPRRWSTTRSASRSRTTISCCATRRSRQPPTCSPPRR